MLSAEKPAAALRRFVRYYVQVTNHFPTQAFIRPVPARTGIALDFMLGDLYEAEVQIGDQSRNETVHSVALIGVQGFRRVQLAMHGRVDEFVILFQPGGLSGLFPVPSDILTNQHFDGRAVLGGSVEELRCRLGESRSFAERIRLADEYLMPRVPHGADSGVIAAARQLHDHRGCLAISGLAQMAALSLRQFERRFIAEVGMSPKLYARVARSSSRNQNASAGPAMDRRRARAGISRPDAHGARLSAVVRFNSVGSRATFGYDRLT